MPSADTDLLEADRNVASPAESDDAHEPGTTRRRSSVVMMSAVVLVAALFAGGAGAWQLWTLHREEARNEAVLDVARSVSADLLTVGSDDPRADVERILGGTTGDLRQQFADVADAFTTVLGQEQVSATGEVTSAGIVEASDNRATVIASVVATVANNEVPQGQRRAYRMQVTLENVDGRWAVSTMEVLS